MRINSNFNCPVFFIKETIQSGLISQQKKTLIIAALIFGYLALVYLLKHYKIMTRNHYQLMAQNQPNGMENDDSLNKINQLIPNITPTQKESGQQKKKPEQPEKVEQEETQEVELHQQKNTPKQEEINPVDEEIHNGEFEQQVIIQLPDGGTAVGDFDEDFTGRGTITLKDGTEKKGDFYKRKLFNQGEITENDGTFLKGIFIDDELRDGSITLPDGTIKTGFFVCDGIEGLGSLTLPDESNYTGIFREDKFVLGKYVSGNGNIIKTGEFENYQLSGVGTLYIDGLEEMSGYFLGDELNGQGKKAIPGGIQTGRFQKNMLDGLGVEEMDDGSYRKGTFVNGEFKKGTFRTKDGKIYEGNFIEDNKLHGQGTLTYLDSYLNKEMVLHGNFSKGELEGYCKTVCNKIVVKEGIYKNGHWFTAASQMA